MILYLLIILLGYLYEAATLLICRNGHHFLIERDGSCIQASKSIGFNGGCG